MTGFELLLIIGWGCVVLIVWLWLMIWLTDLITNLFPYDITPGEVIFFWFVAGLIIATVIYVI